VVKAYAVDFCRAKTLHEATREQVENFVAPLADWTEKDRNALVCQLNSYLPARVAAIRLSGIYKPGSEDRVPESKPVFWSKHASKTHKAEKTARGNKSSYKSGYGQKFGGFTEKNISCPHCHLPG
jgi:hypothetical protein